MLTLVNNCYLKLTVSQLQNARKWVALRRRLIQSLLLPHYFASCLLHLHARNVLFFAEVRQKGV